MRLKGSTRLSTIDDIIDDNVQLMSDVDETCLNTDDLVLYDK
jgi:hypothetical protein